MSIQTLGRWGAVLFLVALDAGCSSSSGECAWYRSSCIYEGHYEPGEADYAEQEAARLNKAQAGKVRRGAD